MTSPDPEYTENTENYAKALQMLGGKDDMSTRVWWDRKNN